MSPRTLLAPLVALAVPMVTLAAASPSATAAGVPMTITAVERGSGEPVPGACYHVVDQDHGGGIAAGCDDGEDGDAVRHDGQVVLTTAGNECDHCEIVQTLPNLSPGVPTNHLVEPSQTGAWQDYEFQNYLKPYLRIGFRDAHTGAPLPGACIAINETGKAGAVFGGCDGDAGGGAGDQDGLRDAVVQTRRMATASTYTVAQTTRSVPAGYLKAAPVDLVAPPAETGDVVTHTFRLVGTATLAVRTVSSQQRSRLLKGACYAVRDRTLAATLDSICDGGTKDDDGARNGVLRLDRLPSGHTYVIDQTRPPRGYRLATRDRTATTVADTRTTVTIANRPR